MKKLLVLFAILTAFSVAAFAEEEKSSDGWSPLSYVNIPVLKVLEGTEGYVVIYQKNHTGVGNTVIPKAWAKGDVENPKKLKFRKLKPGLLKPYMTVVKKDGEFHRVILTLPMNKSHEVWGSTRNIEGADKDTLEELAL